MSNSISDFKGKSNNLNFMKFIAALMVVYHHSFGIFETPSWHWMGAFAVALFFFASGYFVSKSLMTKKDVKQYAIARFARLYPLFSFIILLMAFVVGPIVTSVSLKEYFTSPITYQYLLYLLFIPKYALPGVFESNPSSLVNGSLWSMILEVICYIILVVAFKLKLLEKKVYTVLIALLYVASLVLFIWEPAFFESFTGYVRPFFIFFIGTFFFIFNDRIRFNKILVGVMVALAVALILLGKVNLFYIFVFPYLLSFVVFAPWQVPEKLGNLGNYSYAIYLVGFPIQQCVYQYIPGLNIHTHAIISIVLAVALGITIYKFIEKPSASFILSRFK